MSNLLKTGSDWLQSQRNTHLVESITYARGEDEITINATVGKTEFQTTDEAGFTVAGEIVDFLINATDLVIDGVQSLPHAGDRISLTRNGTDAIFEVMALPGQSHYRYSDSFGKTLRVHTKQIAS